MKISIFRIDDRLIHGQIITAWIAYSDANCIVVADDKAATDEFQQSLLKMATPQHIRLEILSVVDAVKLLKEEEGNEKVLLLVKGPKAALEMLSAGITVDSINVGNLNMKKGKKKVLSNLWVFEEEVEDFKELGKTGVKIEVRAVPNDHSQNVIELLAKL